MPLSLTGKEGAACPLPGSAIWQTRYSNLERRNCHLYARYAHTTYRITIVSTATRAAFCGGWKASEAEWVCVMCDLGLAAALPL
eukprot:6602820-Prymnesium_polylepis.1